MTSCTKPIWRIVFEDKKGESRRTEKVTAWSFQEVLSYYNQSGIDKIVEVEKTAEEVTYRYDEGSK
jgi:hypothetical protein